MDLIKPAAKLLPPYNDQNGQFQVTEPITLKFEVTDNKPNPMLDVTIGLRNVTLTGPPYQVQVLPGDMPVAGDAGIIQVQATPRDAAGNVGIVASSGLFYR